jgi:hypothetical protein
MANTFDSALVTDVLRDSVITVLQSRLAPLSAFTKDFSAESVKPRATIQVPIATAGSTTQTNASDFESGNSTLDNVAVTVNQYSNSFAISNDELNQGFRLENIAKINLHQLANKLIDVALTPVTTTNFGSAVVDKDAATDVGVADLRTLWAALKDGDVRNVILDGSIYAQFLPSNLDAFQVASGGKNVGMYGFDLFTYNNRWAGAGTNVRGFACSPQAIAVASGVPVQSAVADDMVAQESVLIPDLGLSVQMNMWVSRQTRSLWASYDVMFGAAKADGSALKLLVLTP